MLYQDWSWKEERAPVKKERRGGRLPVLADRPANVSTEIFMMIVYGPYVY